MPGATKDPDRHTATMVGIFFIIATVLYLIGGAIYGPATDSSDYLLKAFPDRNTIRVGIVLEFVCVLAIPMIAYFAFPVLKRVSEPLALAYVGLRTLEIVFLIAIEAKFLSLIDVSENFLAADGATSSRFQAVGDTIQSDIDATFLLYLFVFNVGALIFYSLLFRSMLVPRVLSIWGFVSAAWMLGGTVFVMFGSFDGSLAEAVLAGPLAVNEMALAAWLILKGFDRSALAGTQRTAAASPTLQPA